MTAVILRDVEVEGRRVDVRVVDDRISDIGPRLRLPVDLVIDGHGGALLPGLHDHHLHVLATAAAARSLVLDRSTFEIAVHHAGMINGGWMRVVGYHEAVHGPLDRRSLDTLVPDRPVRVQHQTGSLWVLNSPALKALGLSDHPDGHLLGADDFLRDRVPVEPLDLEAVGTRLAAFGVTGLTDATPTERPNDIALLSAAVDSGALPQRLTVTGGPGLSIGVTPSLARGPVKIVLGDHDLPPLGSIVEWVTRAHEQGRPVALHIVTRVALILALAAWDEAGAMTGDRIEHGAVIPPELMERIARHGLTVVTQPSFVRDRGDRYLQEVDADDVPFLYPCAGLTRAGIGVAGSTDAPFGDPDPWRAIAAAVERRTRNGELLGDRERVPPKRALELFLGPPDQPAGPVRRVVAGAPADLCLLHLPLKEALATPSREHVRTVMCRGRIVADRDQGP
jgi:predicted amidohydrolase YtcJ